MNRTTILSVVIALVSLGGAIAMRPVAIEPKPYEDTGDLLFPEFQDPSLATSLEVITWDEEAARRVAFKVEQKAGRWVIPSHHDYPADGTERMGKAAASFIDVRRDIVRSDRTEDHAAFGVEDPEQADASGRGQRVTIKDGGGGVLVDILVGNQVEDKMGYRYVRFPGQKRVYAVKLNLDVSTKFTDWIEKDLLKIERDSIVKLISDSYTVDEKVGKVTGRDPLSIAVETPEGGGDKAWVPADGTTIPAGKQIDKSKVSQVLGAIDRLNIVGIRPRPAQLTLGALQSKGFFVTPDGTRLFGNEGELRAVCDDGVVYTLYFGEVTFDSGLALTAGAGDDVGAGESAEAEGEKRANRFMFVDVAYDPAYDAGAPKPPEAREGEGAAEALVEGPGIERAKKLQARFDQWFYVIDDDAFQKMRKEKGDFLKDAEPLKDAAAAPPPPALPPGFPVP